MTVEEEKNQIKNIQILAKKKHTQLYVVTVVAFFEFDKLANTKPLIMRS